MLGPLLETWQISNRINLYLLDAVADEHLPNVAPSRGRSVGAQFAHLHNVRLMWLEAAARELASGLAKVEKAEAHAKGLLAEALIASSAAIADLVHGALVEGAGGTGGRIKGFKPHAVAFLGYLIAHEAHHRGQIVLTLKQTGAPVDKKVLYGMWEWGVR